MKVTLIQKSVKSFLKDLKQNKIPFMILTNRNTFILEETPKVRMAIKMIKERFGQKSLSIQK